MLRTKVSSVFSEGVAAFCATHKLRGCFVAASRLHLPNINKHVPAFGAFHPEGWQRIQFLVFFSYNGYQLLQIVLNDPAFFQLSFLACFLFYVVTFGAG
jgi:hypothetical protein